MVMSDLSKIVITILQQMQKQNSEVKVKKSKNLTKFNQTACMCKNRTCLLELTLLWLDLLLSTDPVS